jgi:hypothetical protein
VWAAVLLPALYLLSIGPVATVAGGATPGGRVQVALDAVYAPVTWLYNTPLGGPLEWYVGL